MKSLDSMTIFSEVMVILVVWAWGNTPGVWAHPRVSPVMWTTPLAARPGKIRRHRSLLLLTDLVQNWYKSANNASEIYLFAGPCGWARACEPCCLWARAILLSQRHLPSRDDSATTYPRDWK